MNDLADLVIASNEKQKDSVGIPEGYRLDDLGYLVEVDIQRDREKAAKYALFRILKLHNNIFKIYGMLFCDFCIVTRTQTSLSSLYDCPYIYLNTSQVSWVYNRLYEMAPTLSERYIRVTKSHAWDNEQLKMIEIGEGQ